MRVEPDERESVVPRREPLERADVRRAAPAEHERPVGQLGGDREVLVGERVLLDHGRLRIVERQVRGLGHRFAAFPQARGTRTRPAANSRPHEWHWYSGPSATAVYVRQSGHFARRRDTPRP